MSTIAALRCRDGVVLAGDRVLVRGESVKSRNRQHVLDLPVETTGAAAVGRDIGHFTDRLTSELQSYRFERETVSLEVLERMASDVARDAGVEAIVATHDEAGRAALRAISHDGSVLSDTPAVFGSGTPLVFGSLETADIESMSLSEAERFVRDVFESAAERDPGTGSDVDIWTLRDR